MACQDLLNSEKALDFAQHFDEPVHFALRVVKIKTGASGGFDPEFAHQRLIAMMPAAQGNASLIGHHYHIMRVNILQQKTHESGAANFGPEKTDVLQFPKLLICVG